MDFGQIDNGFPEGFMESALCFRYYGYKKNEQNSVDRGWYVFVLSSKFTIFFMGTVHMRW